MLAFSGVQAARWCDNKADFRHLKGALADAGRLWSQCLACFAPAVRRKFTRPPLYCQCLACFAPAVRRKFTRPSPYCQCLACFAPAVRRSPARPASSAVDHTFSAVLPYSCMLKMQGEAIFFQEKCGARDGNFGVESRENRREVYICLQIEQLGRMQREMPLFWDVLVGWGCGRSLRWRHVKWSFCQVRITGF